MRAVTSRTSLTDTLAIAGSGPKQLRKLREKPDLRNFGEKNHVKKTVSKNNARARETCVCVFMDFNWMCQAFWMMKEVYASGQYDVPPSCGMSV